MRSPLGRSLTLATLAIVSLLFPSVASAHTFSAPKTIEIAIGKRLELFVKYDVAPGEETKILRAMVDADRNGTLSISEKKALADHLTETAFAYFTIALDGIAPFKFEIVEDKVDTGNATVENHAMISLAVYAKSIPLKLARGKSAILTIRDKTKFKNQNIPIKVTFSDGLRPVSSNVGAVTPTQVTGIFLSNDLKLMLTFTR